MEAAFCIETLEDALARHGRRDLQHRPGLAVHRLRPSPPCSPATASPSAWTAKGAGGIMCSPSGCGEASNTRRSISGPTKASAKHAFRSAVISTFIIAAAHIRALTAARRIKPTSPHCRSARQPNPGRRSTYRRGDSVQTTGTSSELGDCPDRQLIYWVAVPSLYFARVRTWRLPHPSHCFDRCRG